MAILNFNEFYSTCSTGFTSAFRWNGLQSHDMTSKRLCWFVGETFWFGTIVAPGDHRDAMRRWHDGVIDALCIILKLEPTSARRCPKGMQNASARTKCQNRACKAVTAPGPFRTVLQASSLVLVTAARSALWNKNKINNHNNHKHMLKVETYEHRWASMSIEWANAPPLLQIIHLRSHLGDLTSEGRTV